MSYKFQFNKNAHDGDKWQVANECDHICKILAAQRTLEEPEIKPGGVDDAIFAMGFVLARLLDGEPIDTAKKILSEASRQIDAAHQVDVHRLYSQFG